MIALLGGDPGATTLPIEVPALLSNLIRRIALTDPTGKPQEDAWSIREELGQIADQVYGAPQFIPIVMPS